MTQPTEGPKPTPELVIPDYELTAARRGYIVVYGKLQDHEGRLNDLPEQPAHFKPCTGTYAAVAEVSNRLNEAQIRSGFLDYLYAPEPRKLVAA